MKTSLSAAASKVLISLYTIALSMTAAAQGSSSVVESQGFTPGQPQSSQSANSPPAVNSDALSLLLDQNLQLQSEVQALRALVEEQGFEIRKLQRDSLSRYTNVDDRLSSLETGAIAAPIAVTPAVENPLSNQAPTLGTTPAGSSGSALANNPVTGNNGAASSASTPIRSTGRGTLEPAVLTEQQLYQMAYESVINSNFELSIAEFDQYLSIYADGRFVTNAYYWKGQAYLYLNRYDEARASYEIILSQYQDSPKLPDAMYGLALSYQGLGNIPQARQLLREIKDKFANTGVANLADTRLLSLD